MKGLALNVQETRLTYYQGIASALNLGDIYMVAGEGVADELRSHFDELESTRPNKKNWPRQHLWSDVKKSVQNPSRVAGGVSVSINHIAIGQLFYGGQILPINSDYLTLPAQAAAYGKRAREFPDLHFGFAINQWGKMQPALLDPMRVEFKYGKRKDGSRTIRQKKLVMSSTMYWLVREVNQKPDPSVIPPEEKLMAAANSEAEFFVRSKFEDN